MTASPLPSALEHWDEIERRLGPLLGGHGAPQVALFLDYDGTLSPIAPRPELARFPEPTREAVLRLAEHFPVAILSGRGREDVQDLVGLENVYYAGSHGFDIAGPPLAEGGPPLRHEVGEGIPQRIEEAAEALRGRLGGGGSGERIEGVLVEPKRFAVAVHYRLVDEAEVPRVERAVDAVLASFPDLRKALGKKVFELRPDLDWDKGKALLWFLETLGQAGAIPIYLGDDVTDEDAFQVIANDRIGGIGILVSEEARPTAASYSLRDPEEVRELLERLAGWAEGRPDK